MSDRDRLEAMNRTLNIIVWFTAFCIIISAAALIAWWT